MRKQTVLKKSRVPVVKVVDLFCGAGGLAYGLRSAGFEIAAGVDLDPACRHPFETNCSGEFVEKSVADISKAELDEWFEGADVRVLAGCAPCQPFSTYSQSRRTPDTRWELLRSFLKLAVDLRPEIVTMENVRGLAAKPIWREFVEGLEYAKYHVAWGDVLCSDFGVPQSRKRLVLIASRLGPIEMPTAEERTVLRTVRDAIADLPPLKAGESDVEDALHVACRLSPTNLKRIRASKPGGTWRDWPKNLRATCHKKYSGETYPSLYGRMSWDETAPTMTTQCFGYGNGRFGHPEQDRAITLREAAILQSFPASYSFIPKDGRLTFDKVGMLIGNAVPPKLGEAIGRSVSAHLRSQAVRCGLPSDRPRD
jgi:DNA (cytosine-5)-methyltransferase 1